MRVLSPPSQGCQHPEAITGRDLIENSARYREHGERGDAREDRAVNYRHLLVRRVGLPMALATVLVMCSGAAFPSSTAASRRSSTTGVTSHLSTALVSGPACPSTIPSASLSAITFLSPTTGLGVYSKSSRCGPRLVLTHDSGRSWRVIGGRFPEPTDDFSPVATPTMVFPTARVGWVLGGGALVVTRDGGTSWTRVPLAGSVAAISRSGSSLWAFVAPCLANPRACSYRLEATTLDSGTFHEVGSLPASFGNFPPLVVTRLNPERALVAVGQMGASPPVLTTDGGLRWSSVRACTPDGFVAVALETTGPSDAWALCLGGAAAGSSLKSLARSIDGGEKWTLIAADRSLSGGTPLPVPTEDGDTLAVPSVTRLWMMTVNSFYGSLDGGKRWFTVHGVGSDGTGTFASFSFVSATDGWLLAPYSGLWRTTNGTSWRQV